MRRDIFFSALLAVISVVTFSAVCCARTKQPVVVADSSVITPADTLPLVPQQLVLNGQTHTVHLPQNFSINVFATGVSGARFMCWSPDSVLYVCAMSSGQVIALPDHNNDGIADSNIVVVSGLNTAHSCEFYHDTLYVAQTDRVTKMIGNSASRRIQSQQDIVTGILTGHHVTRTILFDDSSNVFYLSVGSSCNICNDPPQRACILRFNDDGTGEEVYASGLRNSVGLAFNPVTHALWANNNGFDDAGNDIPPEVINIIQEGKFYGWPLAYGDKQFNPRYTIEAGVPMTHDDTVKVLGMEPPIVQVQAHSAPLGLWFYTGNELPPDYKNAAFMCYHGSWDRSPATGYKVVRVRGNPDGTNMRVADFLTGFLTDSINTIRWGRPVGVISDARGDIYISDDYANVIYRIHYNDPSGVKDHSALPDGFRMEGVFPDPASSDAVLQFMAPGAMNVEINIFDDRGDIVKSITNASHPGENKITLDTSSLPSGFYTAVVKSDRESVSSRFRIVK
ncbi:MAG TPA: PQQ-dependent sugar dehydrogenase [Candidatus Kapabacteria bacterium]|nr:PQQ-dependent sugar dehydrogenase [Candidatus Kapabacteria bacterium]